MPQSPQHPLALTVLYDGACPLCRREIDHYRRLPEASACEWVDISQHPGLHATYGISHDEAMRMFHVRDTSGNWHLGADAFIVLWQSLPRYRWLAQLITALQLTPLLRRGYKAFAAWRLRRQCDADACRTTHADNRSGEA